MSVNIARSAAVNKQMDKTVLERYPAGPQMRRGLKAKNATRDNTGNAQGRTAGDELHKKPPGQLRVAASRWTASSGLGSGLSALNWLLAHALHGGGTDATC